MRIIKGIKKWWSCLGVDCSDCKFISAVKCKSPFNGRMYWYCDNPKKCSLYGELHVTRYPCECINDHGYCSGFEKE